tara:strand:- start:1315 stop:1503 length:189 start_codon:yes stop_codon:yes gene_type:complete
MQVQQLPYIAPRKARKQEPLRFVVKWVIDDTVYFQWFKRDSAACAFLNRLVDDGINAYLTNK